MAFQEDEVGKRAATVHKNRIGRIPEVISSEMLMGMLEDKDLLMALVD